MMRVTTSMMSRTVGMIGIIRFADFNHVMFGMNTSRRTILAQIIIRANTAFVTEAKDRAIATITGHIGMTFLSARVGLFQRLFDRDEHFQSVIVLVHGHGRTQFIVRVERDPFVLFVDVLKSESMQLNIRLICRNFRT
jgi:hypothetical protein